MGKFLNIIARPSIAIVLRKIVELNFRKEKEIIRKYFSAGKDDRVLDMGCGTGELSLFFPEENYIGIDIDERNIDYAKSHYPRKFLVADATKLPFSNNHFSKILVIGVLHHLSDENCIQVLNEMNRVIQPDGKILVMEDVNAPNNGYFTNLLHRFDQGKFIRTKEEYRALLVRCFAVAESFFAKNGLCTYEVFILKRSETIQ